MKNLGDQQHVPPLNVKTTSLEVWSPTEDNSLVILCDFSLRRALYLHHFHKALSQAGADIILSSTKSLTFDLTDTSGPHGDVDKKNCWNKNTGKNNEIE